MPELAADTGVVVIGRNEGERLQACLRSVLGQAAHIVYVDSGSEDGSIAFAEALGIAVVRLDLSRPFSAGRARNEGFAFLRARFPELLFVQFVDGDCELEADWLAAARAFLLAHPSCAIATGRRRERAPQQSIYNLLCDLEWDTPIGPAQQCGGDFLIRAAAFTAAGGFNPAVIAGEEPELCHRLRRRDWIIMRLDQPMTLHDAAITRFSQWWRRYVRTGHAYAQGYALHAEDGLGYYRWPSIKCWFWGGILPAATLVLALAAHPAFLLLSLLYLLQFGNIALTEFQRGRSVRQALIWSFFTVLGKFPQFVGQLLYRNRKRKGDRFVLIEYR